MTSLPPPPQPPLAVKGSQFSIVPPYPFSEDRSPLRSFHLKTMWSPPPPPKVLFIKAVGIFFFLWSNVHWWILTGALILFLLLFPIRLPLLPKLGSVCLWRTDRFGSQATDTRTYGFCNQFQLLCSLFRKQGQMATVHFGRTHSACATLCLNRAALPFFILNLAINWSLISSLTLTVVIRPIAVKKIGSKHNQVVIIPNCISIFFLRFL